MKYAAQIAVDELQTLNRSREGRGHPEPLKKHCAVIARQPMMSVSLKFSSTIPIRMNRKFTETVPLISGRLTLSREATSEITQ